MDARVVEMWRPAAMPLLSLSLSLLCLDVVVGDGMSWALGGAGMQTKSFRGSFAAETRLTP
jgi:hypothetical protein